MSPYTREERGELAKALAALVLLVHQEGGGAWDECGCVQCVAIIGGLRELRLIDVDDVGRISVRGLESYPLVPAELANAVLAKVRLLQ